MTPPTITASYSGFVNGDDAHVAHHAADVLDHGHVVEPGRHLPELVLGGRPTPTTRSATSTGRYRSPRSARDHRFVGADDLRRDRADASRRRTRASSTVTRAASLTTAAHVLDRRPPRPARWGATRARARARRTRTTPSATSTARYRSNPAPLTIAASSDSMTYGGSTPTITAPLLGLRERRHRRPRSRRSRRARPTATSSSPVGTLRSARARGRPTRTTPSPTSPGAVGRRERNPGHQRLVGIDDVRRHGRPRSPPSYSGFVNGDTCRLAHHGADVHDHGHVVEPGGQLHELVLGRGRRQLHDHLRGRAR